MAYHQPSKAVTCFRAFCSYCLCNNGELERPRLCKDPDGQSEASSMRFRDGHRAQLGDSVLVNIPCATCIVLSYIYVDWHRYGSFHDGFATHEERSAISFVILTTAVLNTKPLATISRMQLELASIDHLLWSKARQSTGSLVISTSEPVMNYTGTHLGSPRIHQG